MASIKITIETGGAAFDESDTLAMTGEKVARILQDLASQFNFERFFHHSTQSYILKDGSVSKVEVIDRARVCGLGH